MRLSARADGRRARTAAANRGEYADAVYRELKRAILQGKLIPGERLREIAVSRRYGVSRTPTREALQKLEADELLVRDASGGLVVSQTSPEQVVEIYEIRESLEGVAARLAAERATDLDIARVDVLVRRGEDVLAKSDFALAARLNREFHHEVWRMSGNARLIRIMTELQVAVQRFLRITENYPEQLAEAMEEHRALFGLIRSRDGQKAEELTRAHMRKIRDARVAIVMRELEMAATKQSDGELWQSLEMTSEA